MRNGLQFTVDLSGLIDEIREIVKVELSINSTQNTNLNVVYNEELSITEVATLLKTTRQTINNYARQGILKKYVRGGRPYFLRREVLNSGRIEKKIAKKQRA